MNDPSDYTVQFSGLKIGIHKFEFKVSNKFFDLFEYSEIEKADVNLEVELEKKSMMMIFDFKIHGVVNLICDRCGECFDKQISGEEKLIVRFGDEQYEQTDEIIILPESEYKIDLTHYVYEFINLLLPIKRIHEEGECDQTAINNLNKILHQEEDKPEDPRWKTLKGLK